MPTSRRWLPTLGGLALGALVAAGCAAAPADPVSPAPQAAPSVDPAAVENIDAERACADARDAAVLEGLRWLSDIETSSYDGSEIDTPDQAIFRSLPQQCPADPAGAYSDFMVRTYQGFEPITPIGQAARREFLNRGCGESNPFGLAELTAEARRVCTGG